MQDPTSGGVDEGVVGYGVQFDAHLLVGEEEIFEHGPDPLRGGSDGVAVLSEGRGVGAVGAVYEVGVSQEGVNVACGLHLAGMGPDLGEECVVAFVGAAERFHGHGGQHLG